MVFSLEGGEQAHFFVSSSHGAIILHKMKKFITCTKVIVFVPESPDEGWITSADVCAYKEEKVNFSVFKSEYEAQECGKFSHRS